MKSLCSLCWASRLVWEYLSLFQIQRVLLCFAHVHMHVPLALRHASSFCILDPMGVELRSPGVSSGVCAATCTVLAEDSICWPWGTATVQEVGLYALFLSSAGSKHCSLVCTCCLFSAILTLALVFFLGATYLTFNHGCATC